MVVHSSGVSRDYVDEQELSFWEYCGTYWALVPMDLEIDTSHAHIAGENLYPDLNRDELFEVFYYRDGIAYRPSRQNDSVTNSYAVRLGKMEVVEKNRVFRLVAVHEAEELGTVEWSSDTYIQFENSIWTGVYVYEIKCLDNMNQQIKNLIGEDTLYGEQSIL